MVKKIRKREYMLRNMQVIFTLVAVFIAFIWAMLQKFDFRPPQETRKTAEVILAIMFIACIAILIAIYCYRRTLLKDVLLEGYHGIQNLSRIVRINIFEEKPKEIYLLFVRKGDKRGYTGKEIDSEPCETVYALLRPNRRSDSDEISSFRMIVRFCDDKVIQIICGSKIQSVMRITEIR